MSRDGVVEVNALTGEEKRVSQRGQDFALKGQTPEEQSHTVFRSSKPRRHAQNDVSNIPNDEAESVSHYGEERTQETPTHSLYDAIPEESSPSEGSSFLSRDAPNSSTHDLRSDAPLHSSSVKKRNLRLRRDFPKQADAIYERQAHNQKEMNAPSSFSEKEPSTKLSEPPASLKEKEAVSKLFEHPSSLREKAATSNLSEHPSSLREKEAVSKLSEHPSSLREKEAVSKLSKHPSSLREKETASKLSKRPPLLKEKESRLQKEERRKSGTPQNKTASAASPKEEANEVKSTSRLQFEPEEQVGTDPKRRKKAEQSAKKAEHLTQKSHTQKEALPKKKTLHTKKEYTAEAGKVKRSFYFEEQTKSVGEHVKGSLPSRPARFVLGEGGRFVHQKMREVEDDNVAVEAAHKGETLVEEGARKAYRLKKTAPYRKSSRLERKALKAQSKAAYQKFLSEQPRLLANPLSRALQKRKIKKQYQAALKQAGKTTQAVKSASTVAVTWTKKLVYFVKSNPKVVLIVAGILLLVAFIMSSVSSCSVIGNGILGGIEGSAYLADDGTINSVDMVYSEWEADLSEQIANVKQSHSGYDEYRFQVDDISHNPFELIAYFTAVHGEFTLPEVESELRALFEEHYQLSFTPEIEIRYRSESKTDPATGETTTEQVPYEWKILHVQMTAKNLTDLLASKMTAEQKELFDVLMMTRGNRQYTFSPVSFEWVSYMSRGYGYYTDPTTQKKAFHAGVDIEVAAGTDILAAYGGVVIKTGYDSKMGNYILIDHGKGLETYYAHCQSVLVQTGQAVLQGEKIALVGNTGQSQKPHLHFEVRLHGSPINPLFFTDTGGETKVDENGQPVIPEYPGEAMNDAKFKAMMDEATKHLGKPYVFGSSGPNSFDCSGFICWVLDKSGVYPTGRTNAQGLYNQCTPVSAENARPGDLIFFQGTYSTSNTVTHIGIYIGNGQMIHCGNPIQYTSINTNYWKKHFYAFGRLGS